MMRRAVQRGIALPVMMIMLTVMLISSIYLLKSSTSTTMTTANLAYDSALSNAADLGLHLGFEFLRTAPKQSLYADILASGYVATMNPADSVSSPAFWAGSAIVTRDGNRIEYVIHRMCRFGGSFNAIAPANSCTLTAGKPAAKGTKAGESLSVDRSEFAEPPQLHYVVTSRIVGARGGNVVNQGVVMMGP